MTTFKKLSSFSVTNQFLAIFHRADYHCRLNIIPYEDNKKTADSLEPAVLFLYGMVTINFLLCLTALCGTDLRGPVCRFLHILP